jgi:N-acetylneuraminic acid mutarotase
VSGALFRNGRYSGHATTIDTFDSSTQTWRSAGGIPGRSGFGAALLGDEIFISGGGMDDDQPSDRHYAWNLRTSKLREVAPLPGPRYQHGAATLNQKIYIAGGGPRRHDLLEPSRMLFEYDPASNTWTRKADMLLPMRNLALVAHQGKLYAIGGHNVGPDNKGNIVQEYNPATNTWRRLADMPSPRTDIAAVVYEGRIYVLGGHPGVAAVESFDPVANRWRTEPPLPQGRFAPAGISTREGILLVGGMPNQTLLYLPKTK